MKPGQMGQGKAEWHDTPCRNSRLGESCYHESFVQSTWKNGIFHVIVQVHLGAPCHSLECKELELASPACQRCQVFYSGHVQGVGFRYTTSRIARKFEVTGFVRNLPDGRVELVAEGLAEELTAFLREVGERLGAHIRSTAVDCRSATGEFSAFAIRH